MNNSMIERVARAIYVAAAPSPSRDREWETAYGVHDYYRSQARAAIEAMRDLEINVDDDAIFEVDPHGECDCIGIWRVLIDDILK